MAKDFRNVLVFGTSVLISIFVSVRCQSATSLRNSTTTTTETPVCTPDEFFCRNGRCILLGLKCNGVDNCGDNSDETDTCNKESGFSLSKNWWVIIGIALCFVLVGTAWWRIKLRRMNRNRNRFLFHTQTAAPSAIGTTTASTQSSHQRQPSTSDIPTGYTPWTTTSPFQPPPYSKENTASIPSEPPPPYSTVAPESTTDLPFIGFTYSQPSTQSTSEQNIGEPS